MADEDSIEDVTVELKVSEMTMDELMKADLNHLIKSCLLGSIVKRQLALRASGASDDDGPGHGKVTHWRTGGGTGHNRSL